MLATKFGMAMDEAGKLKGGSRRYIMRAVEASLKRLQDRLDRSLPAAPARSADADRGDAARASTISCARARCATSAAPTSPAWQVVEAQWTVDARATSTPSSRARTSTACSCASIERRARCRRCKHYGIGPAAVLPAGERPADRQVQAQRADAARARASRNTQRLADRYITERELADRREAAGIRAISAATRCSSWRSAGSPRRPTVASVIAGATKPEQIEQNVKAVDWALTRGGDRRDRQAERENIVLSDGYRIPPPDFCWLV